MSLFKTIVNSFIKTPDPIVAPALPDVLANGKFSDKRDIEDPTAKFSGPVHIGTVFKTRTSRQNVSYNKSEYDLPMIANAVQLDGILRRAVNIFVEHVLKNGFEFNSKNDRIQKHIARRIKEIEYLTGVAFSETMNQIVTQLVTYGNAYVIKVRDNQSKYGKGFRLFGRDNDPVVGLFVLDSTTVQVGLNPQGNVTTYKQEIRGEAREWDERDIIHFTYNKIPGTLTGQSQILPVLDDVRALRKLEEEIEILGFQYSIPLYLYKVGNKDIPPAPGEVEAVSMEVNSMPAYGMLVVPGHHTIEVPTNANNVMDIIKYVDHFKQRIYSGLGVSPVAMGEAESANRATSEVLDAGMQTVTKAYQQIIKNCIELGLLRELLLDGGFKSLEDEIELSFPEIDIENQIKKETHLIALWQNNLITRTEARNEMDLEANIDETDTFLKIVDIPKIEAQAKAQIKVMEAKAAAMPAPAPKTGGGEGAPALPKPNAGGHSVTTVKHKVVGPPQTKNAKATSNKSAPANQHGKKVRPKYVKNELEDNLFDELSIFNKNDFLKRFENDVFQQLLEELDYTINNLCEYYHIDKPEIDQDLINIYLSGLSLILDDKITRATRILDDDIKLNLFSEQLKEYLDSQIPKIENLAKILVCKSLGFKTILITSDTCEKHSDTNLEISKLDFSKLPPFGYKCKCEVSEDNFHEFN